MATLCRIVVRADDKVSSLHTEWEGDPSAPEHRDALRSMPGWAPSWPHQQDLAQKAPSVLALLRAEALLDFGAPDLPNAPDQRAAAITSERRALGALAVPTCEATIFVRTDGKMEWQLMVPALGENVDGDAVVSYVRNVIRDAIKMEVAKTW